MGARSRRILALFIATLVIAAGAVELPITKSTAQDRPPLGPVIISPELGSWNDLQRPIFRGSQFDLAKVHLPPAFGTYPHHVVDLINDGARVIMLKTEDCESDAVTTHRHLVERGFLELIQQRPDIEFVVQVGNEPERCSIPMNQYVGGLFDVITLVRPAIDQPNLKWVAGLPMSPATAKEVLANGWILDLYDGVGTNMLGHFSLVNEHHGWHEIVEYILEHTDTDLWLTEIGINDPPMSKAAKAAGILAYVDTLPADRVGGVAIFTLAQGSEWPQYEVTESMTPVFAGRDECRFFAPTEQWLCGPFKTYWEEYGGLAIFGYPITAEVEGGEGETVQFFERSRFEWHPGVWPEKHDVLLGHLGLEMIQHRRNESPFQPAESYPVPGNDCVYFTVTSQHLCDEFLDYWNAFGGLPVFGYPVSRELTENGFRVQYFERARFEHHPNVWPERFDVLQGLLGVQAVSSVQADPPGDHGDDPPDSPADDAPDDDERNALDNPGSSPATSD